MTKCQKIYIHYKLFPQLCQAYNYTIINCLHIKTDKTTSLAQ